jgi:hypothetical protein
MLIATTHQSGATVWAVVTVIVAVLVIAEVVAYRAGKKYRLDVYVRVGSTEPHTVHFFRNPFTGRVRIAVDGRPITSRIEWLGVKLVKHYDVPVGQLEKHTVTFVKKRKLFAAGFRRQSLAAYIDGVEVPAIASP